ncbi:MAG: hypothetical protein QOH35_215 [Acidobacteriaceae bacterium]|nr:hypothetical protein [Acidobacteriaceae bacterium]
MSIACTVTAPETERSRAGVVRSVFSLPVFLGAMLVVLAVLSVRGRFDDPDMWWHLKMGQIIWTTHSIPTTDIFSYTTHHHAWVPHEWLAQVLIYAAYRWGGYSGLMLWLCFFTAALYTAGYALCSLYSGNAKIGFAGAMTIWFFSTAGLAIRPQMIGYLFLVFELLALHLGRTRNPRWFFCLPPLFAIWVNCHGSFFLGLIVAAIFLAGSFFNFRSGMLVSSPWVPRQRWMLSLALILSVAGLLLNPVGTKQILYPLNTMLHQPLGISQVQEWQPLQLSEARGVAMLGVLLCIFLLLVVRRSELFWDEFLLLALGVWLAVSHQRMVFVFGILAAPILSRLLSTSWDNYDAQTDRPLPNALLIAASLAVAFWGFPNRQSLSRQVELKSPLDAVAFINNHHLSGRMLNDYVYGGYLIWAAPEHPVFVDGRADVFEWTGVLDEFGKWAMLQSDPNTLLEKYKVDFCLLAQESPMVRVLPLLGQWKVVYSDDRSVVFVRTGAS